MEGWASVVDYIRLSLHINICWPKTIFLWDYGIAHDLLKVAGIHFATFHEISKNQKVGGEKLVVFLHLLYFKGISESSIFNNNFLN
ncbi:hypothetical protein AEA09_17125 [Lysinibacillus contaminans]|uniref:Uncharacterized protein n=1 Tax=Lysinibacillus contaminans TaxID=1293441 RepID=A0ABR5JWT2_9BACI|nr:hypothetical protein AEA09_17125 [Lysinibacillus contaminans]